MWTCCSFFPYKVDDIEERLQSFLLLLKPNVYKVGDWNWLIRKIRNRTNYWSLRWLSTRGRLVLVYVVLQSIHVFWFSLFIVSLVVIDQIRKLVFHFLWDRKLNSSKFHLSFRESISKPKLCGGWGVKHLYLFNQSLCAKTLWRTLFNEGLWGMLIKQKYLKSLLVYAWLRNQVNLKSRGSFFGKHVKGFPHH